MRWNWRNSKDTFVLQFHANPLPNTFITGLNLLNIYIYIHARSESQKYFNQFSMQRELTLIALKFVSVSPCQTENYFLLNFCTSKSFNAFETFFFLRVCIKRVAVSSKIESLTMIGQAIEFLQRRDKIRGFANNS